MSGVCGPARVERSFGVLVVEDTDDNTTTIPDRWTTIVNTQRREHAKPRSWSVFMVPTVPTVR